MSNVRWRREGRGGPPVVTETHPSLLPQDPARSGRPADPGILDDLSLMRVSEQQTFLARKRKSSQAGDGDGDDNVHKGSSSRTLGPPPPRSGPTGRPHGPVRSSPRGALHTIGRLMKLGRLQNVVVLAGAGISTASGIPDFRTPGTGLYSNLAKYNLPYPEAVFNIDFFSDDPRPFYSLAKELYPGRHRPNYVHYFIRMLHQKGLLLRMYSQNIDGLEKMCGIPDDKLVEAHGTFASASCHLCYTPFPAEEAKKVIMSDGVPTCSFCSATVKPNVVFFGEDLPEKYFQHAKDFPRADLLLIMGTSLQIEPFASLVNTVRPAVPRLLLNRHAVGPFQRKTLRRRDYMELGDLVDSVGRLARILDWHAEIQDLMDSQEGGTLPAMMSSPQSGIGQQATRQQSGDSGWRSEAQARGSRPAQPGPEGPVSSCSSEESDSSEPDGRNQLLSVPSNYG
ncbi:NAD-dependent protein deacetylase sirtuin-3 isoform X2 [Brachyhypopomus gauderio]